jgi:hypothetical protein
LVTPKWWDDIWLNEAFATWMGFKAGQAWQPALRFDVVPALQTPAAMELDSRIAARQIRQPVDRNADIGSAFDAITYLKGGAVLGMFESWLGEDGFRAGIRTHMERFPHGVADVEDFMASLAKGSGRPDVTGVQELHRPAGRTAGQREPPVRRGERSPRATTCRSGPAKPGADPRYPSASGTARETTGRDCALVTTPTARIPLTATARPTG